MPYDNFREARQGYRLKEEIRVAEKRRDIPPETLENPALAAQGAYITVEGPSGPQQIFVGVP